MGFLLSRQIPDLINWLAASGFNGLIVVLPRRKVITARILTDNPATSTRSDSGINNPDSMEAMLIVAEITHIANAKIRAIRGGGIFSFIAFAGASAAGILGKLRLQPAYCLGFGCKIL